MPKKLLLYSLTLTLKGDFLVVINPLNYIKESKAELDKVIWPTRQETLRLTVVVLVVAVIVGAYIAGLDALFTKVTERLLRLPLGR